MANSTDKVVAAVVAEKSAARQTQKAVEKTHAKVAQTAEVIEDSTTAQEASADRRTELAADRTVYAAERTYAAWMRSGLAAMAAGVGAKALLKDHIAEWLAAATSVVLVLFAIFCFLAAVWRQMDGGVPPPLPDVRRLPPALYVVFSVFLTIVAAAVLVGLWAGH